MQNTLDKLNAITTGCRDDMHEPDEQGITAKVIGTCLDNACGEDISDEANFRGYQEMIVIIERGEDSTPFNLATLIALARKAKLD